MLTNPFLYLVTPEIEDVTKCENIIRKSVMGGVRMVQIRAKISSAQQMIHLARRVQPFLKQNKIPLLINDRVDIAHAVRADGVHLGQSDLKVAEARNILGKQAIIGLSIGTIEQAMNAIHEEVNYLAASPVFETKTKNDCGKPWGLQGLKNLCAISTHPIIAIGGINSSNLEDILQCGVTGVAIISAIFKAPCAEKAAIDITNKMRAYGKLFKHFKYGNQWKSMEINAISAPKNEIESDGYRIKNSIQFQPIELYRG